MTSARCRGRRPVLTIAFALILGLYAFFIVGVLVADSLYLAGTPAGRQQFRESLSNREVLHAIWVSLWTSTVSALIGIGIATPTGYVLSRGRFPGVRILDAIIDVPIILPPLVFGISLLVLFQRTFVGRLLLAVGLKFVHDPKGIVLVQTLITTAFGARMLKSTFDGIDPRLAGVAETLGCSRAKAFFSVTLPAAWNGVVAALVTIWALSLALYGPVMAFVGATCMRTEVMPTRMFLEMNVARLEAALSLALMMVVLAVSGLLLIKLLLGGRNMARIGRVTDW